MLNSGETHVGLSLRLPSKAQRAGVAEGRDRSQILFGRRPSGADISGPRPPVKVEPVRTTLDGD